MQKALSSITTEQKGIISRNWVGLQAEPQIDYDLLWQVIIFASVIIIFFAIWNTKLKEAQARAEAANEAKSAFLANMSHEIRTPLNAIMGFSDAMLNGLGGEIKSPQHKEYLRDIKNSGDHLATVINDILDLSKIESGKWQLREDYFRLNDCLSEALKMIQSKADDKNITIGYNTDREYEVYGDLHSIKRIFINLISNAVKYTPEGGTVICTITLAPGEGVKVEITDNGIGIPEERIEEVLKPFEQTNDSHELDEEGTGLGLAIVDHLIKAHNGTFTLTSEYGIGTTATVILPEKRLMKL
nr:HAMP domain-containing sensor histidine kinase [Pseudemcibacter aquimaris]